jgi:hypothetical protein
MNPDPAWQLPVDLVWRAVIALADAATVELLQSWLPADIKRLQVEPHEAAAAANQEERPLVFANLEHVELLPCVDRPPTVLVCEPDRMEAMWERAVRCHADIVVEPSVLGDPTLAPMVVSRALRTPWHLRPQSVHCGRSKRFEITSSTTRDETVTGLLAEIDGDALDTTSLPSLRLVLEELLNNALLHGFHERDGTQYRPGEFTQMRPGDRVWVESAVTTDAVLVGITDSAGSLTADTVRRSIHRQLRGEALMESSGRGLFIGFSLCDLIAFNLEPGSSTQVVVALVPDRARRCRALLINTR